MNKNFIPQAGKNYFVKEVLSGTDPLRRPTLCMTTNEQFCGTRVLGVSHYQPFGLRRDESKVHEDMQFDFQAYRWMCGTEELEPTKTDLIQFVSPATAGEMELVSEFLRISLYWRSI